MFLFYYLYLQIIFRVKKPERTEPSLQVSEFHLVKSGIADKDAIAVHELAKTLRQKSSHVEISKKINTARYKTSVLEKPLEKPAAEKVDLIKKFSKNVSSIFIYFIDQTCSGI